MTTKQKQAKIKKLVTEMLKDSHADMVKKIDGVLSSGAIDFDAWSEDDKPMIIPKCIAAALLEQDAQQYMGRGTSYEKMIKKEVNNIRYFI